MDALAEHIDRAFGPFVLRARPLRLERDGATVALRHKGLRLLQLFAEQPGALISHDQIRARLWADRHVDFARGIHLLVREVRSALGDDADAPRYVETLPRQGYRFIADVLPAPANPPVRISAHNGPRRWIAAGAGGLVAVCAVLFAVWPQVEPANVSPAREAVLKGQYLLDKGGRENLQKSEAQFNEALALDAAYAPAHAGLAELALTRGDYARAETAAKRALDLAPQSADAHLHLAMVAALRDWDWREADRLIDTALKLDPNSAKAYGAKAMLLTILGRTDEALAAADTARAIDPVSALIRTDHGWFHYYAGDYAAALQSCGEAAALAPENSAIAWCEFRASAASGNLQAAGEAGARILNLWNAEPALAQNLIDHPGADDVAAFYAWQLDLVRGLAAKSEAGPEDLAAAFAQTGDFGEAAAALAEAARARAPLLPLLLRDPLFAPIRSDDRYLAALSEAGLSETGRS